MAKVVQLRKGTTEQHSTFIGALGELTMDTSRNTLKLHDNATTGGHEIGVGARGNGLDKVFFENDQVVTTSYTITTGKNAMSAGPITVNDGVTVTIPSGSSWTIV